MCWRDLQVNLLDNTIQCNGNQKMILEILIKKYEDSKSYFGLNKINQRFSCLPSDIYKDYYSDYADLDAVDQLNQDIYEMAICGLINIQSKNDSIDCIYAITENYEAYCQITGWVSKRDKLDIFAEFFEMYLGRSNTLDNLCHEQLKRIENHKENTITNNPDELKKILNCIEYIESNDKEIMERELSIQLFANSKSFEKTYKAKVCSLLIEYGSYETYTHNEKEKKVLNTIVLAANNIVQNPTYIYFKGNGIIVFSDGTSIELSYTHPIAIISNDLQNIQEFIVQSNRIFTIENLTSYNRMCMEDAFLIYLSGYHNKAKSKFLKLISKCNQQKQWYHFGDIDPDGFYILENLRVSTGMNFIPYKMGINELSLYSEYTKPLEQNDIVKAKSLQANNEFMPIVNYMLENDCKLEQEIISWKDSCSKELLAMV